MFKFNRIFAAVTILVGAPLFAATYVVPPDRILFDKSDAVIVGHVTGSRAAKNPQGNIATTYDVRVEEVIKGAAGMTIRVTEPGGTVNGETHIVFGTPAFASGERVLLFLDGQDGNYATTDLGLGAFRFAQDTAGVTLAIRDEAEIVGWDLNGAPHKEIRRSADAFVKYLREIARAVPTPMAENYAVPARPLKSESLVSKMQTDATGRLKSDLAFPTATATSYTLDIEIGNGSGMGARWRTFPNPVNWNVGNSLSGAPGNGNTAIDAALGAWNNDTCSNVNYVRASAVANLNGIQDPADGVNNIVWEKTLNNGGMPPTNFDPYNCASGGLLGLGGISVAWTGACGMGQDPNTCRHTFNGEIFATTTEGDVSMNRGIQACTSFSNSTNLNSAVAHEVGHTLGFRHSDQNRVSVGGPCDTATMECSSSAIMTASITNGLAGALQAWDQHAVQKLYASSCTGVASVRGDFSGDGKPDITWRNPVTGLNAIWVMDGTNYVTTLNLPGLSNSGYKLSATADFNGDGQQDILWRNPTTGANAIWLMNGINTINTINLPGLTGSQFSFEGAADFDGNGTPDIIIRNYTSGNVALWMMTGTTNTGTVNLPSLSNTSYHIESAADFDGNGTPDIVWRNYSNGNNALWTFTGTNYTGTINLLALSNVSYKISAVGDFNGDTHPDIVWRNASTGANAVWLMNGGVMTNTINLPGLSNPDYEIRGPR
jgi:hypothetical protein